jgi:hypothetical protein
MLIGRSGNRHSGRVLLLAVMTVWACGAAVINVAHAGGGPENAILIIDPTNVESLYVGHYYMNARNIPPDRVIYMPPVPADFATLRAQQAPALIGTLEGGELATSVDYVIVPPGSNFYISATGLVSDGCATVRRFSSSTIYTIARLLDEVAEGVQSSYSNEFYKSANEAYAFDSYAHWNDGFPSDDPTRPRFFIGAMLGYTGERGNTMEELIDMIDRSVAVDGTRPAGTFYFMRTTDQARSGPRHNMFPAAVSAILFNGGQAMQIEAVLPEGRHDAMGIMTGWASPDIDGADMTILPGAFCDHLTSFAGKFDTGSQTKLSRWIANGASGSHGAVEEPCNYAAKFPQARMHVQYQRGASLGEAVFRTLAWVPFHTILYGDPLTRPFAHLPEVEVDDAPQDVVTGTFLMKPDATTSKPGGSISGYDLYVDGVLRDHVPFDGTFEINTTDWADGYHDLRVVAYENSDLASQGRWVGSVVTDNHDREAVLTVQPLNGTRRTTFDVDITTSGATVAEMRLERRGGVLVTSEADVDTWTVLGKEMGAGPTWLQAVVRFEDGTVARSEPVVVSVSLDEEPDGLPGATAPVAYDYSADAPLNLTIALELPATDLDGSDLTFTIVDPPVQATAVVDGSTVFYTPDPEAAGSDILRFRAHDGAQDSNVATISITYGFTAGDWDRDGDRDLADYAAYLDCVTTDAHLEPLALPCRQAFDWDVDEDADAEDYGRFAAGMTGPQ